MFLLDTNVISELRRQSKADRSVLAWYKRVSPDLMFVSPVVFAEMEIGVRSLERRDKLQAAMLRIWVENIFETFKNRCIPIDQNIARIFARLQVPDRRPERDAWIAATALEHSLTVVTRNEADFKPMDVPLLNPWR
jgi:toxin FitB